MQQEVLHPVEEEAFTAAQELLPLGLAAQGGGSVGRAARQGQAGVPAQAEVQVCPEAPVTHSPDVFLKQRHPTRSPLHPHSVAEMDGAPSTPPFRMASPVSDSRVPGQRLS